MPSGGNFGEPAGNAGEKARQRRPPRARDHNEKVNAERRFPRRKPSSWLNSDRAYLPTRLTGETATPILQTLPAGR